MSEGLSKTTLSKRFEDLVKKIIDSKDKAYRLAAIIENFSREIQIQLGKNIYRQITTSYEDQLMLLRKISSILDNDNDKNDFDANICNGILSIDVINNGFLINNNIHIINDSRFVISVSVDQCHIDNLKCLDEFSQESKDIINNCLDAFNEDYVLSDDMYDKIKDSVTSSNDSHIYEKLILEIHFKIMMYKLYFMWQMDPQYAHSLKEFNEIVDYDYKDNNTSNTHIKISLIMFRIFDSATHIDDYKLIFKGLESRIKEYSNINILGDGIDI